MRLTVHNGNLKYSLVIKEGHMSHPLGNCLSFLEDPNLDLEKKDILHGIFLTGQKIQIYLVIFHAPGMENY